MAAIITAQSNHCFEEAVRSDIEANTSPFIPEYPGLVRAILKSQAATKFLWCPSGHDSKRGVKQYGREIMPYILLAASPKDTECVLKTCVSSVSRPSVYLALGVPIG